MKKTKKEKINSELEWHLEKVKPLIEEAVKKIGYGLLLIEFVSEYDSNYLRLTISHQDKLITLEDCEKVSRCIEEILDEKDLIAIPYMLEVQSPGKDVPMERLSDLTVESLLEENKNVNYDWDNHEFSLKGLDLVVNS